MQVEISEKAQETVAGFVSQGDFASASEVIDAALALLAAKQKAYWERVNELVEVGRKDIREGRFTILTEENKAEVLAGIVKRGRARLNSKSG